MDKKLNRRNKGITIKRFDGYTRNNRKTNSLTWMDFKFIVRWIFKIKCVEIRVHRLWSKN